MAGTLIGGGVANAAPTSFPDGGFQTCNGQGGGWNTNRDSNWDKNWDKNRDCRNRYPTTYTRTTSQTVNRSRDGVNVISARCNNGDRFLSENFVTVRGNVRNIVTSGVVRRPDGYFVAYRSNRAQTEVRLTITCRR